MDKTWIEELLAAAAARTSADILPDSTPMLRATRSGGPNCELLAQPYRPPAEHADSDTVVAMAMRMIFARPLIMNAHRGIVVEAIVNIALGTGWTWTGADWGAYDFVHADGTRLEVKQSAARQSWEGNCVARPTFDIAPRTGLWEGTNWRAAPGRNADLYLFAYHPLITSEADHRNPAQWRFHIAAAASLPASKSIGLRAVERLGDAVTFVQLAVAVEDARAKLYAPFTGNDQR